MEIVGNIKESVAEGKPAITSSESVACSAKDSKKFFYLSQSAKSRDFLHRKSAVGNLPVFISVNCVKFRFESRAVTK